MTSYAIDRQRHTDRLRRELELLDLQGPELPPVRRTAQGTLVRCGRGPAARYIGID